MGLADSAWLRMEQPTNPMTITGVMGFGRRMPVDSMRRFMEERIVPFDRFQMRVLQDGRGRARWDPDPDFRIDRHVVETTLPEPGGKEGLQDLVSALMSEPLSFDHSPWTVHLVHDVEDGGSAAIVRIHHVIGDGIALMHVLISAADEYYDPDSGTGERPRRIKRPLGRRIARTARGALDETVDLLTHPSHLISRLSAAGAGTKALAMLLAMRPDSETVFKGSATPDKRAAWTTPFELDRVRAIGTATDSKVNDVLMASAAGALRTYLLDHGQPVDDVEIRVAAPFNVRALERAHELGNSFGLVFVPLPVSIADPVERLRETKQRMDAVKASSEPAVTYGILQSIGGTPKWVHRMVVKMFSEKASAVLTNVPGPREPLHIEGIPIGTLMFWVPQAGDIGLGISILSMAGTLRVGVCADAAYVPDPGALADAFNTEFERLAEATLAGTATSP